MEEFWEGWLVGARLTAVGKTLTFCDFNGGWGGEGGGALFLDSRETNLKSSLF